MRRRSFLLRVAALPGLGCLGVHPAFAARWPDGGLLDPLFLHGTIVSSRWADPVPSLELLQSPAARAALTDWLQVARARQAPAPGLRHLEDAAVPPVAGSGRWRVQFSSLQQLGTAGVGEPHIGQVIAVVGEWRKPVGRTLTVAAQLLLVAGRIHLLDPAG